MEHLPDEPALGRGANVRRPVGVDPAPRHEAQRRVEPVADAAVEVEAVPEIVRVVDLQTERRPLAVAREVVASRGEAPDAGGEVLVARGSARSGT